MSSLFCGPRYYTERNMLHSVVRDYRKYAKGLHGQILEKEQKVANLQAQLNQETRRANDLQTRLAELNERRPMTPGETADMETTYSQIHAAELDELRAQRSADDL